MTNQQDERERLAQVQRDLDQAYFRVFTTDDGKTVLRDIERESFMEWPTFARQVGHHFMPDTVDPLILARNEGMRTVALRIRSKIDRAKQPAPPAVPTRAVSATAERKGP